MGGSTHSILSIPTLPVSLWVPAALVIEIILLHPCQPPRPSNDLNLWTSKPGDNPNCARSGALSACIVPHGTTLGKYYVVAVARVVDPYAVWFRGQYSEWVESK